MAVWQPLVPGGPSGAWPGLGHVLGLGYVSPSAPRASFSPADAETRCYQMRYMPDLSQYASMFRRQVRRVCARAPQASPPRRARPSLRAGGGSRRAGAHFQSARRVGLEFPLRHRSGQLPSAVPEAWLGPAV